MPTYEYRCPNGHQFELFQRMTDPAEAACPECGSPAERRISGGSGFLFKGEGFYITDYRSEDYKKKKAKEPGDSTKSAGTEGGTASPAASGDGPKAAKSDESGKAAKGGDTPGPRGSSNSTDA